VGATAALVQLGLLRELTALGVWPVLANAIAFAIAAQLNFVMSCLFTWSDRVADVTNPRDLAQRWIRFDASIAGTATLNLLFFAAARQVVPDMVASALGIGLAAVGNFTLGDLMVFRPAPVTAARLDDDSPLRRGDL
jgi:putative flippase GtrA